MLIASSRKRASRHVLELELKPQAAVSAYDKHLQLSNIGIEIGVNGFALHVAELVVYLPFACNRCRCLYPGKLWLCLYMWMDDSTIIWIGEDAVM